MTGKKPKAWVGDQVYDAIAEQEGVVTDVRNGLYVLRPLYIRDRTWTAPNAQNLTVTVPREKRVDR